MSPTALPDGLVSRFRERSIERLGRIEMSWYSVIATRDAGLGVEIERAVHTLKGDARLLGFHDISMLCHKLEDLLRFARSRDYVIPQTIDLLVAPLVGLVRLLLHKRAGQPMAGVDLVEFSRQVDTALREAYLGEPERVAEAVTTLRAVSAAPDDEVGHVSPRSMSRLAAAASAVYLLALQAPDERSRGRLLEVWSRLARELRQMRSQPLAAVLTRHGALVRDLALRLGKQVIFSIDLEGVSVGRTVAPIVEMAVTHAVTNAVDHGIEPADERGAAGKDPTGQVRLLAVTRGDQIEVTIEDDGRGVDIEAVRRKAVEAGVLRKELAYEVDKAVLLEMLMLPNFSTRDDASPSSGRGVGLDAVRTAVSRHGGRLLIETEPSRGTRVTFQLPQDHQELAVARFALRGRQFAIAASWRATAVADPPTPVIDLVEHFELGANPSYIPAPQLSVVVEREGARYTLSMDSLPALTVADRLCATGEDAPYEVLLIDGGEVLFIRPEQLR